jgi:hypothetical protein
VRFLWALAVVVVLVAGVLTTLANLPAELSHLRGTPPVEESFEHACPADEPGMRNCSTATSYRWRLAGGAEADTTFEVSRDDVTAVTGVLDLASPECRDARVAWQLTIAGRVADGELAADDRSAGLNVPVPEPLVEPLTEVRLRLWRTDAADCAGEFRWGDPGLDVPAFSLPL